MIYFLIAIVDENEQESLKLKEYIEGYFGKKEISCIIRQFSSGVEFIRSCENFNIVFLETCKKEIDGLDTARICRIINKRAQIIFTTNEQQLAICGYEVDAVDFMLKPIDYDFVSKVLDRTLKRIDLCADMTFALKTSEGVKNIALGDIKFIEIYNHDLVYHTGDGDFMVRGNLNEIYQKLEKYQFIQCNRSYLVNMRYIKSIHKDYMLVDGIQIRIAKLRQKEITQKFIAYVGRCI